MTPEDPVVTSQSDSRLDELFARLLTEEVPAMIRSIESRIWRIWLEADDLATLQPHYLRMPSIGGPKRRDHAPQSSAGSSA